MFLFACSIFGGVRAQTDSTAAGTWRFDITGGAYFQQSFSEGTPTFLSPDYLQVRRPVEPDVANQWGLRNNFNVTDNPLGHGPMYIRPHAWYRPNPSLELYASLAIDHRGASWGPYNTDNIAFIPRFHAAFEDWKKTKNNDSLRVFGKMGYFEDYRLNEGLTLYNMDVQGLLVGIEVGRFTFTSSRMGDLVRGYGLGIDGLTDYQLAWNGPRLGSSLQLEVKSGIQNMIGFPATGGNQIIPTIAVALYNQRFRLYAEAGYRNTIFSHAQNSAAVLGFTGRIDEGRFWSEWRAEYRYYGGGFNHQFRNEQTTHYRDIDRPAGSNFIGDSVYPLEFVGRPFSQWAVFAEYDKPWVQGISIAGNPSLRLARNVRVFVDVDVNVVVAHGEQAFCYPFYNAGLKMNVDRQSFLTLSLTNRTMNLDKHYTTYYLLEAPIFQFELRRIL